MALTWISIKQAARRLCCAEKKLRRKNQGQWKYYPAIRRMQHGPSEKVYVCAEDVETFMAQFEQPQSASILPAVSDDTISAIRKETGRKLAAISPAGALAAKKLGYL